MIEKLSKITYVFEKYQSSELNFLSEIFRDSMTSDFCEDFIPLSCKVHIFWEGHKISQNLPLTFVLWSASQK